MARKLIVNLKMSKVKYFILFIFLQTSKEAKHLPTSLINYHQNHIGNTIDIILEGTELDNIDKYFKYQSAFTFLCLSSKLKLVEKFHENIIYIMGDSLNQWSKTGGGSTG